MEVGTEVRIIGRVQSRNYEKKYEDGRVENRVAYEVSIASMEIVNKEDNEEMAEENNSYADGAGTTENESSAETVDVSGNDSNDNDNSIGIS